jgi:hypothetical protein
MAFRRLPWAGKRILSNDVPSDDYLGLVNMIQAMTWHSRILLSVHNGIQGPAWHMGDCHFKQIIKW